MKDSGGYSLIEVLLAIIMLGLVLIGGSAFFFYGSSFSHRAKFARIALELVEEKIDLLKEGSFLSIKNEEEILSIGNLSFTRKTMVESVDEDGNGKADYKKVKVRVSWGRGENVEVDTIIGR